MNRWQRWGFAVFLAIVIGHWVEHLAQAAQIYLFGWETKDALGGLGLIAPGLVRSEWLHWVYNFALFAAAWLLLSGFSAKAAVWWKAGLVVQGWHLLEHSLLLGQALNGIHLFGGDVPTSLLQTVFPRVELHLFYNAVVTWALVAGAYRRWRPADSAYRTLDPETA